MVHALKEAWNVLRPGGLLIDLRPRHSNQVIEVICAGQPSLITRYSDNHGVSKDNAADMAMTKAVKTNLFTLEQGVMFEYIKSYDTGSELMDYLLTRNPPVQHSENIVKQILQVDAQPEAVLRFTNAMQLKRYRKVDDKIDKPYST